MNLRILAVAFALLVVPWAAPVAGEVLPAPESRTLSDFARVLDGAAEARLRGALAAIEAETGVQMVVVTLPSIAPYAGAGMRLDEFAKALLDAWGVGDGGRNDGILMLVATEAREARIALGSGYDAVYDGRAARVLSQMVLPALREGRLTEGVEAGVAAAREFLVAPFVAGREVGLNDGFPRAGGAVDPWLYGFGAVGVFLLYRSFAGARARRTCPRCGARTLNRTREVIEPPGATEPGSGIEHMSCTTCGLVERRPFSVGQRRSWRAGRDRTDADRSESLRSRLSRWH